MQVCPLLNISLCASPLSLKTNLASLNNEGQGGEREGKLVGQQKNPVTSITCLCECMQGLGVAVV